MLFFIVFIQCCLVLSNFSVVDCLTNKSPTVYNSLTTRFLLLNDDADATTENQENVRKLSNSRIKNFKTRFKGSLTNNNLSTLAILYEPPEVINVSDTKAVIRVSRFTLFEYQFYNNYTKTFSQPKKYKIQYKKVIVGKWITIGKSFDFGDRELITINNLDSDSEYLVRTVIITADQKENIGNSNHPEERFNTSRSSEIANKNLKYNETNTSRCKRSISSQISNEMDCNNTEQNLTVYSKNEDSISLKIKALYPTNGILHLYNITYYTSGATTISKSFGTEPCQLWPSYHCVKLLNLKKHHVYTVLVAAQIEDAQGYLSNLIKNISVNTTKEPSEAVYDLNISWTITNDLKLEWKHPNVSNGDIEYFNIWVISIDDLKTVYRSLQVNQYTLTYNITIKAKYLSPSTRYIIKIGAFNGYYGIDLIAKETSPPIIPFFEKKPKIVSVKSNENIIHTCRNKPKELGPASEEIIQLQNETHIYCFTNFSQSVLIVTPPDGIREEESVKNNFHYKWLSNNDWTIEDFGSTLYGPILGERWKGFKTITSNFFKFPRPVKPFSVYGTADIKFYLGNGEQLEILTFPKGTSDQWYHFSITASNNTTFIYESNKLCKILKDFNYREVTVKTTNTSWKIHNHKFMKANVISDKPTILKIPPPLDQNCLIWRVALERNNSLEILWEHGRTKLFEANEDSDDVISWKTYVTVVNPNEEILIHRKSKNEHNYNSTWAVDLELSDCNKRMVIENIMPSKRPIIHKCVYLDKFDEGKNISQLPCEPGKLGSNCTITCESILGKEYPFCEEHKICRSHQGILTCNCSWGYTGSTCQHRCSTGTWGLSCSQRCQKCGKCDFITGECSKFKPPSKNITDTLLLIIFCLLALLCMIVVLLCLYEAFASPQLQQYLRITFIGF